MYHTVRRKAECVMRGLSGDECAAGHDLLREGVAHDGARPMGDPAEAAKAVAAATRLYLRAFPVVTRPLPPPSMSGAQPSQ